jgi:glycosyltransferase involved in cell wall biosynthesis
VIDKSRPLHTEVARMSEAADSVKPPAPISVVVLTYMEEINLEKCLSSVAGWAGDVQVVDSGSTDRTLEIAQRLAHRVHVHPYVDHTSQIRYILSELQLEYEWLLILDADHEVSDELKANIALMLANDAGDVDLFYCPQVYVFRNRPIRSLKKWTRLIRHRNAQVEGGELVDFRFRVKGSSAFLRGNVIERNLKDDDLDLWIDKHQRFSSRMAIEEALRRAGRIKWSVVPRFFGNPDERLVWLKVRWYFLPLFVRPFLFFAYRCIWERGVLDGMTGLLFHFLQAFWFRLVIDIKLFDLERRIASGSITLDDLSIASKQ